MSTKAATPDPDLFKTCMLRTAEVATDAFDRLIDEVIIAPTPVAAKVRRHLREEYDWKSEEFSVKDAVDTLVDDRKLYLSLAGQATNIEQFYSGLEAVARVQIDELIFSSNNYPEARLRRDQFCRFVDAAADVLRSRGYLKRNDTRFDDLVNGYDMSLHGYAVVREHVHDRSGRFFDSLLEYATAEEGDLIGGEPDPEDAIKRVVAVYQEIAAAYGVHMQEEGRLLPPGYLYLADMADRTAYRQLRNDKPYLRDSAELHREVEPYRKRLLNAIAAMPINPYSLGDLRQPENFLIDEEAKAFGQPVDFMTVVCDAAAQAREAMEAALPRLHGIVMGDRRRHHARGHAMLEQQGMETGHIRALEKLGKKWGAELAEQLAEADTLEDIIRRFEQAADETVTDCITSLYHPGLILAGKQFAEAMGKNMAEAYRARGLPTRELDAAFAAIAEKYELGYESHWEAARWCLEQSENAYGNYGEWAMAVLAAHLGKMPAQLGEEELGKVAPLAKGYLMTGADKRQLPEAWQDHPYMPILYRRAVDFTVEQVNRVTLHGSSALRRGLETLSETTRGFGMFPQDRDPLRSPNRQEKVRIEERRAALEQEISDRVKPVLERAIGMFADEVPHMHGFPAALAENPTQTQPYLDCRTLHDVMDFFEQSAVRGRAH